MRRGFDLRAEKSAATHPLPGRTSEGPCSIAYVGKRVSSHLSLRVAGRVVGCAVLHAVAGIGFVVIAANGIGDAGSYCFQHDIRGSIVLEVAAAVGIGGSGGNLQQSAVHGVGCSISKGLT